MLHIIRSKLNRIETLERELDVRHDPPSAEVCEILRAYGRWKFERQGRLYERRDQGDEKAQLELGRIRDERMGLSQSEVEEHVRAEINELLASGELDQYMDPWPALDLN